MGRTTAAPGTAATEEPANGDPANGTPANGTSANRDPAAGEGRSARKRRGIMEAATELFLRNGYQGTSMDDIAAAAAVSKQTVYKNFADKERLFADIVRGAAARADEFVQSLAENAEPDAADVAGRLTELARRYVAVTMQPRVLQLRRLVVGEAGRFPELAHDYYQRAPRQVVLALGEHLRRLAERGLLRLDDAEPAAELAAGQFAFLVLGLPLDKALFHGDEPSFTAAELRERADSGVRVFLAAYGA